MNFDLNSSTVYLVLAGSRSYGTFNETSDWDYRGVCIPNLDNYFGLKESFEQIVDSGKEEKTIWKKYPSGLLQPNSDMQVMDFVKFCKLAVTCNPNIIELLFTDSKHHIRKHPIMDKLLDNKELFLSRQSKNRFAGYATAQVHKMKVHKRWLDFPLKVPPVRSDFDLPDYKDISKDQLGAIDAIIQREVDLFVIDQQELPEHVKIELNQALGTKMRAVWSAFHPSKEYPCGFGKEFTKTEDALYLKVAERQGLTPNFIELLRKQRKFLAADQEWKSYQTWLRERNVDRAKAEKIHGYDCYVEETEFLTEDGWKKFDNIKYDDKLATVFINETDRPMANHVDHLGVEYQKYTEKFDGTFTGNLYNLYGFHTNVLVTPNHRMLVQKEERKSGLKSKWSFENASNLPDTFNVIRNITPKYKNYSDAEIFDFKQINIPDIAFLMLMGWYLSDGSVAFNNSKADDIRISQIKNGKLYLSMKNFENLYNKQIPVSFYESIKPASNFNPREHTEAILSVRGNIPDLLYKSCGNVKNKRIPRWVFQLSKRKMEVLLDAMIMGDGTINKPDNAICYYSSLENLANDVQELAFLCGFETSLYGPYFSEATRSDGTKYQLSMYHVYINKTHKQTQKFIRSQNIRKIPVENKRIVCFTVPNGNLITRLNGQIGIHGNCKNALHCVRLLRMGREILTTGQVLVSRPDVAELKAIRNGAWKYEEVLEFAEKENRALDVLVKDSKLPHSPPIDKLHKLVVEMVLEFNLGPHMHSKDLETLIGNVIGEIL